MSAMERKHVIKCVSIHQAHIAVAVMKDIV